MSLTDVSPFKEKDDRSIFQKTGIFVTRTKSCPKKNFNSNIIFAMCCLLYLPTVIQQCLATIDTKAKFYNYFNPSLSPPAPHECGSVELRNNCNDFYKLSNCSVITGYLNIANLPMGNAQCDFSTYQFENLREVTDFIIITHVRNLTSIKTMFPNLTVIRGRRLFLNYALVITSVADLEKIEFKSLIAIQRGHVFIDSNPKLCYLEKINWNRLTLSRGTNNIFYGKSTQCPAKAKCNGCKRDSCWSNDVCQKLENDSVLSLMQDTSECDSSCLGGCYNNTMKGCVVCKSWTDHGSCVDKCPSDKYASSRYLRCYTRDECVINKEKYIFKNTCVEFCPSGYDLNNTTKECEPCEKLSTCNRTCNAAMADSVLYISSLMAAEAVKGCHILNATLMIDINEYIDEDDLALVLEEIYEITGHLKINRSPYITSLRFLKNLRKIHGKVLENKMYALIIYNNKNLSDLWTPKAGFEILNGGMYIHANDKLCNRRIREFRDKITYDRSQDAIQTSDQEVLCSPAKLNLYVQVLNHNSLKLYWAKEQTSDEVEIISRPLNNNERVTERSELDTDVCKRINWRRELKFAHELEDNSTHFSYILHNLEPHTKYACLVKTFNGEDDTQDARSEIKYATTLYDIPVPPTILIKSKSYDSLQVEFTHSKTGSQVVDYYLLEVYDMPDDKDQLDTRDYCDEPIMSYKDYGHEDYDDCCSRREEEKKDQMFLQQLRKDFSCTLDHEEYCNKNDFEINVTSSANPFLNKRFEVWETNYTINSLETFHLYVIQVQACNHAGCSSYSIISTRTNYSVAADKIYNFSVCKISNDYEYEVYFSEPQQPNGYITSYALHLRDLDTDHRDLICITRLEHERSNYIYIARSNYSFSEAAVRVHSLGQHSFTGWINITTCSGSYILYNNTRGWNIFLVCFLIGAFCTVLWVCYKRRYWQKIPQLRHHLPSHINWWNFRPGTHMPEDRQILVENFEAVRFHNNSNDEIEFLEHS